MTITEFLLARRMCSGRDMIKDPGDGWHRPGAWSD